MSSLIPEKPLLISPSLAATIGLEEATMLSVLADVADHREPQIEGGFAWLKFNETTIAHLFAFWSEHDIQRIAKSLSDKGIVQLRSAPYVHSRCLDFCFNEQQASSVYQVSQAPAKPHNNIQRGANLIAPNWQPSDDVLSQLQQQRVDKSFAMQQLPEFITFWRERGEAHHSWGAKFMRHVLRKWRHHETDFSRRESSTKMNVEWAPSSDVMDVLVRHANISQEFVEDAIPEFILFWQERGDSSKTWNSKFLQHVRRQWNKYTATIENETVPKPISAGWQPGEDVYDVLRLANIDIVFAESLVKEFVLFWKDCGQVASSWNTKFLQHAKYHWAKNHQALATSSSNLSSNNTHKTRERSLVDDLTDRSWAY